MSVEEAKLAFDVIQTLMIAIIGIMNYLNNRQRVTNATINALKDGVDARLDSQFERLTRLEQDVKHAPNHADLAEIYREMRNVTAAISSVNAVISGQAATLKALNDQLIFMSQLGKHER